MTGSERMDEFEIIARYFTRETPGAGVLVGIGDDAAVLSTDGPVAVTVDTLVEGVHFAAGFPPRDLGYRALAVNLSDIAAMGAEPRWTTLALTLPSADAEWIAGFAAGFFELAERFRVALAGGDLTHGPLSVTVQVIGAVRPAGMLLRSGGRPGDDVYVTGCLGDAAGWLAERAGEGGDRAGPAADALSLRFSRPDPRVAEGLALAPLASAAIDVSDGLLADLGHICRASRCGARVEVAALPLSDALLACRGMEEARRLALAGGDDYELCFTAAPERAAAVEQALAALGTRVSRIGRLTEDGGVECLLGGEPYAAAGAAGYLHFRS